VDVPAPTLLPKVLNFLSSSFAPSLYLDVLVQCTRKTELRSWHTLFSFLPPPRQLFDEALRLESLKTAGGYLLVLHALDGGDESGKSSTGGGQDDVTRLLALAKERGDWELCGELARFLMALDASGDALRKAVVDVGLRERSYWGDQVGGAKGEGESSETAINGRNGGNMVLMPAPVDGKGGKKRETDRDSADSGDYFVSSSGNL
jgi:hypothetical protein